jgi:geranylgeranyl pyrophosphate synthase
MNMEQLENPEEEVKLPVTYKETMSYLREINKEISPMLREAVLSIEDPETKKMADYFFEPRYDKPKGRPLLARLSFETVAEFVKQENPSLENSPALDPEIIKRLLVAIRILDGASILHDDILDHDETRDTSEQEPGRESVWKKFGSEKAIIAGEKIHELANTVLIQAIQDQEQAYDGFVSKSDSVEVTDKGRSIIFNQSDSEVKVKRNTDIHSKVIGIFNSIWDEGYTGQRLDHDNFGKETSPTIENYENRLFLLTGQFHEKVMLLGAYAAGIDDEGEGKEILKALGNYGKYYGIAAQLRNDLLDFVPEGGFNNATAADRDFKYQDFIEGKQTMPIILAREKCLPEEWQYIHERIGNKELTNKEKNEINQILVRNGIFKDCERRIFELSKMAITELDKIPWVNRKKEMLQVFALIESNMIKRSFAGEDTAQDVSIDSIEELENYFSQEKNYINK